jgi:hypothetical protein
VQWARHHNVSDSIVPVLWGNFIKQIWPQHLESVQQQRSFCVQDVMQFRQLAKQLVCHNADHEPFHVHLFCPKLYLQTVAKTWSDPEVFVRVDQTVQQAKDPLKDMVSPRFQTLYDWGFNFKADLPYGYCFLKRKKQWTTARTIVSYCASAMSKLMAAFAMLLRDICSAVWQDSLSALKAPQMWRALHNFLDSAALDQDYHFLNDDLVGFFNSVPQERLLQSVAILLQDYLQKYPSQSCPDQIEFYYAFKSKSHQHVIVRGNPAYHQSKHMRRLIFSDVCPIVQLSFEMGIFTAIQQCWKQVRGTSMGNQLSPVL